MPATDTGIRSPYLAAPQEVLRALRVRPEKGLSASAVKKRRELYGKNEIPTRQPLWFVVLFLDRFKDVLVIILLAAAFLSFLLGNMADVVIITVAIAIDVLLSFAQVWRTEKTLARMRQQIEDTMTVLRNGTAQIVPSKDLVVGDIIEFRAGERIPADARLIRAQGLQTQEASLTGESTDTAKHTGKIKTRTAIGNQTNMIFAGTVVVNGNGTAVVTAVGTRTEFGKIAQVLREQKSPPSPLRRKLQRKGVQIGWIIIAAVLSLMVIGLLEGQSFYETGRTAITLIVSAIPEDLTMILTIALTVGVARILRKGGVVRKLASGETLGAATIICTDKTGTLTEGNMKAVELNFLQGDSLKPHGKPREGIHRLALISLALANDAHQIGDQEATQYIGSATERTALAFVEGMPGVNQRALRQQWKRRDSISFNTSWKYRVILVDHPTQSTQTMFITGAPDVLLNHSSKCLNAQREVEDMSSRRRFELQNKIEVLASQGSRLIAVAVKRHLTQPEITHDDIHDLTFLGVLSITDPVRSEVYEAIQETVKAGVDVKLITGDHAATARAVASQVGLPSHEDVVCTGERLQQMTDRELQESISSLKIFARVEPLDKQRIIRILRQQGHVVAMTGDGVNDAVALKSADIGVAMGSGSDVAKDAADLVLLNNSFATIVAAIKEGRVIRDNIRKVIAFLLATNAAEVAIFFVSLLLGLPLPLLPAQILWINLVTDGTSDIALSLEPAEDDVMKRRPEDPAGSLLGRNLTLHILLSGLVMTVGTMTLFWYLLTQAGHELAYARTMAFTFLSVSSLLSVWSFRSLKHTIYERGFWQNKWILVSGGFSFGLHLVSLYIPALRKFFDTVPLAAQDWFLIIALALLTVLIIDFRKYFLPTEFAQTIPPWQAAHQRAVSRASS